MKELKDKEARIAFGARLKGIRENKNMTQVEIASKAGIHFNYYARIERGDANPSLDMILTITKTLGIKPSDLVTSG